MGSAVLTQEQPAPCWAMGSGPMLMPLMLLMQGHNGEGVDVPHEAKMIDRAPPLQPA